MVRRQTIPQRARALLVLALSVATLVGCNVASGEVASTNPASAGAVAAVNDVTATPAPTATIIAAATATSVLTPTSAPTATATSQPTATAEPTTIYPPVVIDPGHGGEDLGTLRWEGNHMTLTEAGVNLDLALRVREQLTARGIPARLTRDGDYALLDPRSDANEDGTVDSADEAQARVDAINATDAVVMLSIHQNALEGADGYPRTDIDGTIVYYCADRPFAEESKAVAELVHEELLLAFADLGHDVRDRGVWDDLVLKEAGEPGSHLILLGPESNRIARASQMPGALSETMFIAHPVEGALASDPAALDRLAGAYANALQRYLDAYIAAQD